MENFLNNVFDRVVRKELRELPDKMLLGVSGGVDSLALCLIADHWCRENQVEFHTVTIDHHLREESSEEAAELHQFLASLDIENEVFSWREGSKITGNIEDNARKARYKFLSDYAHKYEIPIILTAHHFDDQIETFFMRLARGSGIDGLAAMERLSRLSGPIKLLRPFLEVKKSELVSYLTEKKIKWFEDETNNDERFLRNKVRRLLSEIEERDILEKRIMQTIIHCSRAKDFIENQTNEAFHHFVLKDGDLWIIDVRDLRKLHKEIALRVLIKILNKVSNGFYKPRYVNLKMLFDNIVKEKINKRTNFAKSIIEIKGCKIVFSPEEKHRIRFHD